jgi:hypothetical protein
MKYQLGNRGIENRQRSKTSYKDVFGGMYATADPIDWVAYRSRLIIHNRDKGIWD